MPMEHQEETNVAIFIGLIAFRPPGGIASDYASDRAVRDTRKISTELQNKPAIGCQYG